MPKRKISSTWLTRPQVAALIGMTEEEVAALDEKVLRPVREGDRSWRYDPTEVGTYLRRGAGAAVDAGEIAAKAFEMFEAGKNEVAVVVATRRIPSEVHALRVEYDKMAGALTLPTDSAAVFRRLFGENIDPTTIGQVVERELEARYAKGHREAAEEGEDYGELIDPVTNERRKVKGPERT
jgi:hypothetical protein